MLILRERKGTQHKIDSGRSDWLRYSLLVKSISDHSTIVLRVLFTFHSNDNSMAEVTSMWLDIDAPPVAAVIIRWLEERV